MLEYISVPTFKQLAKLPTKKSSAHYFCFQKSTDTRNGHSRSVAGSAFPAAACIWEGTHHGGFKMLRFVNLFPALFMGEEKKN